MNDLENFSYLIPGELAGMAYPSTGALDALRELGFSSVVSLSRRAPPVPVIRPLIHLHCPLADFTRIPALDLHRVVAFLDRAPRPVVIHGEGGVGRTGVALACRLVSLGRSATEAIAEVRQARPGSIDDVELEASVEDYARFYWNTRRTRFDAGRGSAIGCPFNFAPASPLDRIVHGAERPGFGASDPSEAPLEEWLGFMGRQGIREVVCLLGDDQVASYGTSLLNRYRREFLRVTHAPMENFAVPPPEALDQALDALVGATRRDAPVVVHCAAGMGRTAVVLAAWLRARHGLEADEAIAAVRGHARHFGAFRDPLEAGDKVLPLIQGVRRRP